TLEQSTDGEFFNVADGDISGLVYGFIPFSSGLTGSLNCKTLKLEKGYMPHGKYNFLGVDYPYEGPLHADYDKLTHQFVNGKWRVGEPTWKEGDPDPQFGGFGDAAFRWRGRGRERGRVRHDGRRRQPGAPRRRRRHRVSGHGWLHLRRR